MERNPTEDIAAHHARNTEIKQSLVEHDISLTVPRDIECHFLVSGQEDAALLGKDLVDRGFLITMLAPCDPEDQPELWTVEARTTSSPEHVMSAAFIEDLVNLAATRKGEYDGWGTEA